MDCDFLVVGGGPSGTTFASLVANRARVVVLEEHREIGVPVQCTGLVTPRVVEMADAQRTVLNKLNGAVFHFPGEQRIEVHSKETKALVVDRAAFDRVCAERCRRKGAEIRTGERFIDAAFGVEGALVKSKSDGATQEYNAKLLIGADGYKSNVGRSAGIEGAKETVRGIQLDIKHVEERQDMVDVYIGNDVAPGFFAWKIPCKSMTRIGVCVSKGNEAPVGFLSALLKRLKLEHCERIATISGLIPIGPPSQTYAERMMLIGDAAAQAKPLSGGGLYTSMLAAHCAAETAISSLEARDFSAYALSSYQEKWRAEIGKELDRGSMIRKAYLRLSDAKLEEIGKILGKPEVCEVLSTGDIDYPSILAPQVLKAAPSLFRFAPQFLKSVFLR